MALSSSTPRWLLPALLLLVAAPRVAVFATNENLYGDAVARMDLAREWSQAPHWISSFDDGARQFGPLHLQLLGLALWLDPDPLRAGRWVSLLFGTVSVLPLFMLTRRLFGWQAGAWAGVGLAAWGMHIQCSTTAASEAVALFWLFAAFALIQRSRETGGWGSLVLAAVCMNVAAGVRYDPWMLMPLAAGSYLLGAADRGLGLRRAVLFGVLCLPFPLVWMAGNALQLGDPLYPLRFTDHYHHQWAVEELGRLGPVAFRLQGLLFWPGAALFTLTPVVAVLGAYGALRSWRRVPQARWLVLMMVLPSAYYAFRMVVPANFVPLARFAVPQLALLLIFWAYGAQQLPLPSPHWPRRLLVAGSALAAAVTLGLGLFTLDREGKWADSFRPVSPVSQNPPSLRAVVDYLKARPASGPVVLDSDPGYLDLQVAAFLQLPESRLVRARWPDLEARLTSPPGWVVVAPGGTLQRTRGWRITGDQLVLPDGQRLPRVWELPGPLRVYGPG